MCENVNVWGSWVNVIKIMYVLFGIHLAAVKFETLHLDNQFYTSSIYTEIVIYIQDSSFRIYSEKHPAQYLEYQSHKQGLY